MTDEARPSTELDDEGRDLLREYLRARDQIAAWTTVADDCSGRLKKMLDDYGGATLNGQRAITYDVVVTQTLDQAALKAEQPDIAARYRTTRTTRPFRISDKVSEVLA